MIKTTELDSMNDIFDPMGYTKIRRVLYGGCIPTRFNSFEQGCYLALQELLDTKPKESKPIEGKRRFSCDFPSKLCETDKELSKEYDKKQDFGIKLVNLFPMVVVYDTYADTNEDKKERVFLITND